MLKLDGKTREQTSPLIIFSNGPQRDEQNRPLRLYEGREDKPCVVRKNRLWEVSRIDDTTYSCDLSIAPIHDFGTRVNCKRSVNKIAPSIYALGKDPLVGLDHLDDSEHIDRLNKLCTQDESMTLEFKGSYRVCAKDHEIKEHLREAVLKTIVAMINTQGGTLVVGIHDEERNPTDTFDFEVKSVAKNRDKFLNQLGGDISREIGKEWSDFYRLRFITYRGKPVLMIDIERHPKKKFAYLKNNPYIRLSAGRTELMDAKAWGEYVLNC